MCTFPAEVRQSNSLPSFFTSHTVNKCPFHHLFSPMSFIFLCFLLKISLFEMAPKDSAKLLPSAAKLKKAVMCLSEKIHVLHKLCAGMSYS